MHSMIKAQQESYMSSKVIIHTHILSEYKHICLTKTQETAWERKCTASWSQVASPEGNEEATNMTVRKIPK